MHFLKPENYFPPEPPKQVVSVYGVWQHIHLIINELVHQTLKGLRDIKYLKEVFEGHKNTGGTLLIIDDQMRTINQHIANIFTIYPHYLDITRILFTR